MLWSIDHFEALRDPVSENYYRYGLILPLFYPDSATSFSTLAIIFVFFLAEFFHFICRARSGIITSSLSFRPIVITCRPNFVR